jgi:hydroxypyruvate isomerase
MRPDPISRRDMLSASAATLGALAAGAAPLGAGAPTSAAAAPGRLKQSVARWCFSKIPLPELARGVKAAGLVGIDLLQPDEWAVVRDVGLVPTMGYPANRNDFIPTGWNDRANHAMLLKELEATVPRAAKEGVPNVIGMFGNRKGKSDAEGAANCVAGLRKAVPLLEQHGVTLCLELLNSKVDHPDYQGDRTAFGVDVVRAVDSPRVKLLYDIYHMQIMEGDVIRTIRDHKDVFGHYHTAGVPGRHEIDRTQELDYAAVSRAIAETGFTGIVAQEFTPTKGAYASLEQAVKICDV